MDIIPKVDMRAWGNFNILKHLRKHFLFIVFSCVFFFYLSIILLAKDFFGVDDYSKFSKVIFLSLSIYIAILGIYLADYANKLFLKEKHLPINAVKIVFYLVLAFSVSRYLAIFNSIYNQFTEAVSYLWNSFLDKITVQTGAKRPFLNPAFLAILFSALMVLVFFVLIWTFRIEIKCALVEVEEIKEQHSKTYFDTNLSVGYLYKALP